MVAKKLKWARIESDIVAETTLIDPKKYFHPSIVWVTCPDNVNQNYRYIDGEFLDPVEPQPSEADLLRQKQVLMQKASETISTLQDAVDLGMATEDEQSSLLAWKKYRVLVSRVDTSTAPDIEWPEPPISI